MNQSSLLTDEDQDSLFGSPPPSPGRGRSPSQDASAATEVVVSATVVSGAGAGAGRKNVGTIALPGSHMSCAELPADLPVSTVSHPHTTSSSDLSPTALTGITATSASGHTPSTTSRSSSRSVPSRASSAASSIPSATASTRKRRTPKAKSLTPAPSAPPITLPGPNQPTPPNFLRSQSSLLGLAGVVGCVKPTQLYTHAPQPTPVQPSHSHIPARGSTPAHPIVLDDDQHTSQIGKGPRGQLEMSPPIDQLNPEILRSNILSSLTKERDIFPVLESLVKLLGGESRFPSRNPPPEPFARPYGYDIFNVQSYNIVPPHASGGSPTSTIPPPKRRKLKHVPAGAADWDVPFPFAAGEGPEAYRDTWAQDRAKQLMVQLLELVRNATKRAAIKTSKSGEGRVKPRSRSSRSTSVETQIGQINSTRTAIAESMLNASITSDSAITEISGNAMPIDNPCHFLSFLESPLDSECMTERGCSPTASDHLGFEEWLSQLQSLLPLQADTSTRESSELSTQPLAPSDSAVSMPVPAHHHAPIVPQSIQDQAIDPTLLALSQGAGSPPQSQFVTSPTSTLAPGDVSQVFQIPSTLPVLSHTPRTSLSSVTGPPSPPSEALVDTFASAITHEELVPDSESLVHEPGDKNCCADGVPASVLSPFLMESPESRPTAQKGKARSDADTTLATPPTSSQPTPSAVSTTSKGALDKQAILECARARRRKLVAEIERAKLEMRETSIEGAMLLHLTRDRPS